MENMRSDGANLRDTMMDEFEINKLLLRYCRGADRCDLDLMQSCYHPDSLDERGPLKGRGQDFSAGIIGEYLGGPPIQHSLTNVTLDVRGDVAFGECYVMSRSNGPNGEALFGWGRYIDRFERYQGKWLIKHRRLIIEGVPDGMAFDLASFTPSLQDRTDASYER